MYKCNFFSKLSSKAAKGFVRYSSLKRLIRISGIKINFAEKTKYILSFADLMYQFWYLVKVVYTNNLKIIRYPDLAESMPCITGMPSLINNYFIG